MIWFFGFVEIWKEFYIDGTWTLNMGAYTPW